MKSAYMTARTHLSGVTHAGCIVPAVQFSDNVCLESFA